MKELILKKLEVLDKEYDMWLRHYEEEGQDYQEKELNNVRSKIFVLNEILRESEEK